MTKRTWTEENLRLSVIKSKTYSEVMLALGLAPIGGNYKTIKKYITSLNLSTNHFMTAQEFGKRLDHTRLTEDQILERHFRLGHIVNGSTLRRFLSRFQDASRCSVCASSNFWNGMPLTLQIDHINGDRTDNRLDNLRYICPNCHTQTHTFAGRRNKKLPESQGHETPQRPHVPKTVQAHPTKINWPTPQELYALVSSVPTSKLAKKLGVSDVAIGKKCKEYGIEKPLEGFGQNNAPVAEPWKTH